MTFVTRGATFIVAATRLSEAFPGSRIGRSIEPLTRNLPAARQNIDEL